MAKKVLKMVCESILGSTNTVRFVIDAENAPKPEPGKPAQRVVRSIVTVIFPDKKDLDNFTVNKATTITLEQ